MGTNTGLFKGLILTHYKTQDEFACVLGISPGYLSELVSGKKSIPYSILIRCVDLLQIPAPQIERVFFS